MVGVEEEREFRFRGDLYSQESTFPLVLLCSLVVLDPSVGHTIDVLSPFISVLCHSDWCVCVCVYR